MYAASLVLLTVAGAGVAIEVEDARDVSMKQVGAILGVLDHAIAKQSGSDAKVRPYVPGRECVRADRCTQVIKTETGASEIVRLGIFAVPSRVRITAERTREDGTIVAEHVDLMRDEAMWPAALEQLARALYPRSGSPTGPQPALPPLSPADEPVALANPLSSSGSVEAPGMKTWPLWLIGGSVVAGTVGVVLGFENARVRDEGMRSGLPPSRVDELQGEAFRTGLGANLLFAAAATGLVTGAILLATE